MDQDFLYRYLHNKRTYFLCTFLSFLFDCKNSICQFCFYPADYSLFGHVISNITVPDVISCSFECLSTQRCLSYNFKDANGDATNICELNEATKDATPRDFHGRIGYKYYDTEKVCTRVEFIAIFVC